jgi:hypothetical protein
MYCLMSIPGRKLQFGKKELNKLKRSSYRLSNFNTLSTVIISIVHCNWRRHFFHISTRAFEMIVRKKDGRLESGFGIKKVILCIRHLHLHHCKSRLSIWLYLQRNFCSSYQAHWRVTSGDTSGDKSYANWGGRFKISDKNETAGFSIGV